MADFLKIKKKKEEYTIKNLLKAINDDNDIDDFLKCKPELATTKCRKHILPIIQATYVGNAKAVEILLPYYTQEKLGEEYNKIMANCLGMVVNDIGETYDNAEFFAIINMLSKKCDNDIDTILNTKAFLDKTPLEHAKETISNKHSVPEDILKLFQILPKEKQEEKSKEEKIRHRDSFEDRSKRRSQSHRLDQKPLHCCII